MAAHGVIPLQKTLMTEAEYLASDFEIDPDFVNGHLEERFVGDIEHANWQRALLLWFAQNTPLLAASDIHVRVAEGQFRIPDVAIFNQPPRGAYVTEPPLAVIEILSPSDSYRRLRERLRAYQQMGVHNLFLVESRTEFSQYKDDKFVPILTGVTPLEGTETFLDWQQAATLLWPNDTV